MRGRKRRTTEIEDRVFGGNNKKWRRVTRYEEPSSIINAVKSGFPLSKVATISSVL
jgi:hypothetical protein